MDYIKNNIRQEKSKKSLLEKIQYRLAMSDKGVRTFAKAVVWQLLNNLAMFFPVMLVYLFLSEVYRIGLSGEAVLSQQFLWLLLGLAVVMIGLMFFTGYKAYMETYTEVYRESANMRISLAEHLRKLPLSFFDKRDASDLTTTIMTDVSFLENLYTHQLPQLCGAIMALILMSIGLPILDWRLALALLWVVPVAIGLLLLSRRLQYRSSVEMDRVSLEVKEKVDEGLQQVQTIYSCQAEERYLDELSKTLRKMERTQMRVELLSGVIINSIQVVIKLGLPTLMVVGTALLFSGSVRFETLLFFFLISSVIYQPLLEVLINGAVLIFAEVKVNRMNAIYDLTPQEGRKDRLPEQFDIAFNNVSFAYNKGEAVLNDLSFVAKQGETTALIGPSGGGKSTCARLASRFWDVDSGSVTLGGINLNEIDPETLLQYYAIVFQDVVLFDASVMDNIRIGRRDASDEEVIRAAKLAQCDGFVEQLPDGYNTLIGENGSRLSGGERQRISIARAILKDAPVIILDEATASQDAENESEIQRAISSLIENKTVLIIAHRMRTIAHVDKIVTIEMGRVTEMGTPQELLAREDSAYRRMVELQQLETIS